MGSAVGSAATEVVLLPATANDVASLGLPAADTECLVIANDSVYGPFGPLGPLLSRMDFGAADAWGMTETWQIRYHLQSYFVAFGRILQRGHQRNNHLCHDLGSVIPPSYLRPWSDTQLHPRDDEIASAAA